MNTYQNEYGKNLCFPCKHGYCTKTTGSDHCDPCGDDGIHVDSGKFCGFILLIHRFLDRFLFGEIQSKLLYLIKSYLLPTNVSAVSAYEFKYHYLIGFV